VTNPASARPPLTPDLSGSEFLRWYWLKEELASFARSIGQKATGSKALLTQRIAAALDGRAFAEPPASRSRSAAQLSGTLSGSTVIPAGQRCSQVVRKWLSSQIGPTFHFDAAMRAFFSDADGTKTLQDAVAHWHKTRNQTRQDIDPQFEYNRFTRAWHDSHPAGTRDQLLAAWNLYRSQPIDERGRI
jgi:hypothetical protein